MSHATADLEYFKCDMCGTYMHKEIFCDHRRNCKGKDSVELTKKQAAAVAQLLEADERKKLQGTVTSDAARIGVEKTEKMQLNRTRRQLHEQYLAEKMAEEQQKQTMSIDEALAFLES